MKTIKIGSCSDCPYEGLVGLDFWCGFIGEYIGDEDIIHPRCPLKTSPIKLELTND